MSLFTEIFGVNAIYWRKNRVIDEINKLPRVQQERRSYLLKDWGLVAGVKLTNSDFARVEV